MFAPSTHIRTVQKAYFDGKLIKKKTIHLALITVMRLCPVQPVLLFIFHNPLRELPMFAGKVYFAPFFSWFSRWGVKPSCSCDDELVSTFLSSATFLLFPPSWIKQSLFYTYLNFSTFSPSFPYRVKPSQLCKIQATQPDRSVQHSFI